MDSNRGKKKKPTKGARLQKTRAAKGAKVAVVVHDEPTFAVAISDPWLGLRSPLGGKLSPAEEWKCLQDAGCYGRELTLTGGVMANAAVQASTPEEFRLASATLTLPGKPTCENTSEEVDKAIELVAAAPTAPPNGDDDTATPDDDDDRHDDIPVERLVLRGPATPTAPPNGDDDTATPDDDDDRHDDTAAPDDDHRHDDDRPVERLVLRGDDSVAALLANSNALANGSGCARRLLTTALVKLDVGGTRLDDAGLETVIAVLTPWLRELSAAGNYLTRIPLLKDLGKLQILDISKNKIGSIGPESFPAELGPTLRSLNLEGNRLDSLLVTAPTSEATSSEQQEHHHTTTSSTTSSSCALHVLTSLVELNLSANCFESSLHSLSAVTRVGFPRLVRLDFRGNPLPLEQETNELQRISKSLPTLKTLNGEEVSRKAMPIPASKAPLFELLSTGDQCVKEGRREESCSCVEGNACAVSYFCRDWANRFEVAAAATAAAAASREGHGHF